MVIDSYDSFKKFLSEKHNHIPTLLLHACCAPCSSYVLELLNQTFDITIYYYNPNIWPASEYETRAHEFSKLGQFKFVKADFNPDEFYQAIKGLEKFPEGSERCFKCYELRLENSALYASQNNFDFFTTTLSISPYKNSDKLNEIGQRLASKYQVPFLYSNFKKNEGYKRSIKLSQQFGLYRQDYCGCVYSYEEAKKRHLNR